MIGQPKTVSWVIVSRIGLRGVFQYYVTRYLIVWPFLGALPFSTVLAVQWEHDVWGKRSRSRKARQSFHNLLKIVFHTWLVYYQVPLMIGEIPISDACHYMDAHDTETSGLHAVWSRWDVQDDMRNCDELPMRSFCRHILFTAIVTLLLLVLLLASLENKVSNMEYTVNSMHTSTLIDFFL